MKQEEKKLETAMGFYHKDGIIPAWQQAMTFTGKDGRIATMPDIVKARLETKPDENPWQEYYTTLTAEYYGFGKSGKLLLIVAHGIGPMSTLAGITKAYSWEHKDRTRRKNGGRITQKEFLKLEAGKYGEVTIIDYEEYCKRYEFPFIQILTFDEAIIDPVLKARLGSQAEDYVIAHFKLALVWHAKQAGIDPKNQFNFPENDHKKFIEKRRKKHLENSHCLSNPFIIKVGDASNCSYYGKDARIPEKGFALAHLISAGGLCNTHHSGNESLVNDISCHEWYDGVRLVGIKPDKIIKTGIQTGPNAYKLLRENWQQLLKPVFPTDIKPIDFCALTKINEQWFTQYQKLGASMDSWEPEFVVLKMDKIGEPVLFKTTIGGYAGFFKYDIKEIQRIAPPQANAYTFIGEPEIEHLKNEDPKHHIALVQFFTIEADTTKQLIRCDKLNHDFKKMIELMG